MKKRLLLGQKFGRLLVVEKTSLRSKQHNVLWRCRCDCGKEKLLPSYVLTRKVSKVVSCGCWKRDRVIAANATPEMRKIWTKIHTGKTLSESAKAKVSAFQKGKPKSLVHRQHMRDGARRGADSHLWKGGIAPIHVKIRASFEYNDWRRKVFRRDGFKCRICGVNDGTLEVHHIIPFHSHKHLRFVVDNGVTFCGRHHKAVHVQLKYMKCA